MNGKEFSGVCRGFEQGRILLLSHEETGSIAAFAVIDRETEALLEQLPENTFDYETLQNFSGKGIEK